MTLGGQEAMASPWFKLMRWGLIGVAIAVILDYVLIVGMHDKEFCDGSIWGASCLEGACALGSFVLFRFVWKRENAAKFISAFPGYSAVMMCFLSVGTPLGELLQLLSKMAVRR